MLTPQPPQILAPGTGSSALLPRSPQAPGTAPLSTASRPCPQDVVGGLENLSRALRPKHLTPSNLGFGLGTNAGNSKALPQARPCSGADAARMEHTTSAVAPVDKAPHTCMHFFIRGHTITPSITSTTATCGSVEVLKPRALICPAIQNPGSLKSICLKPLTQHGQLDSLPHIPHHTSIPIPSLNCPLPRYSAELSRDSPQRRRQGCRHQHCAAQMGAKGRSFFAVSEAFGL